MVALARPVLLILVFTVAGCMTAAPPDDGDDGFTDPGDDGGDDDPVDPGECMPDVIAAPTAAACAAATRTCIEACADDACWEACLAADPNADACGTCLEDGYLACANDMGCQAAWDAVICCYDQCVDPAAPACETSCTAEDTAYDACIAPHDETCAASTDAICFGA